MESALTGILLGILVGMAGGMWLLFSLVGILKSLRTNQTGLTARISAILSLPVFLSGNTWAARGIMRGLLFNHTLVFAYLASTTIVIAAINAIPCYRIILWAIRTVEE